MIIKYKHHSIDVSVREDLKGKHRDYCLCYLCAKFKPENRSVNCQIANLLFDFDILHKVTTPVWECKKFQLKEEKNDI